MPDRLPSAVPSAPPGTQGSTDAATHAGTGTLLVGIDEAGLGPLLGPLAIGWVALRVPDPRSCPWKLCRRQISRAPLRDARRVIVADSKEVHARNPRGRKRLEKTALSFLTLLRPDGRPPADAAEVLFGALRPTVECVGEHPWYARLPRLPQEQAPEDLELSAALLARELAARGIALVDAGVRLVPAGELNASYDETDNKAETVWLKCLEVLRHVWQRFGTEAPRLTVDILGGRLHYGPYLGIGFPDASVELVLERGHFCAYRLAERAVEHGQRARSLDLEFRAEGEKHSFAVALASCLAKYARETVMAAFNDYFCALQPELKPTAGYNNDGRRWLAEAAPALERAGLPPRVVVRNR